MSERAYEWYEDAHDDCPIDAPHGHLIADRSKVTFLHAVDDDPPEQFDGGGA